MNGNTPDQRVVDVADGHELAVATLRAGGVIVLPTDTVYGLAACATQPDAIERIYALKQRPADLAVAILVADADQAAQLADLSAAEQRVACALWPGALTLILRRKSGVDTRLGRSDGTVGVRAPSSDFVRAMARKVGPLATTSANLSGSETAHMAVAAATSLTASVDLIVDGGRCSGQPSTVAQVGDGAEVRVYRTGEITAAQIELAARSENSG